MNIRIEAQLAERPEPLDAGWTLDVGNGAAVGRVAHAGSERWKVRKVQGVVARMGKSSPRSGRGRRGRVGPVSPCPALPRPAPGQPQALARPRPRHASQARRARCNKGVSAM